MNIPKRILPVIVISQFCCTSLWFAGNGVMSDLISTFGLQENALGHLTSAVQLGFIGGTLMFSILTIADRFAPSKVFLTSALLASMFNLGLLWAGNALPSLFFLRFFTGFFLAGIYPVGMKIATDYYDKGLGKSMGFLVGALVVGTAFPHLLKGITALFSWEMVLASTSFLAGFGGFLLLVFVPNGPFRKESQKVDTTAFFKVFKNSEFRAAAFGYFGHMWELYTFWVFVPIILKSYVMLYPETQPSIPFLSFSIIAIGGVACILGAYLAEQFGTKSIAKTALLLSCLCCLISPFILSVDSIYFIITFLLFWGMVVVADSPLFSTLVAQNAPAESKGTALTIVNCIGFLVTIVSIQLLSVLQTTFESNWILVLLAIGPVLGLIALKENTKREM